MEELKDCRYCSVLTSREGIFFDHVRRVVKWRKKYDYDERLEIPGRVKGFDNTLSKVEYGSKRWSILSGIDI